MKEIKICQKKQAFSVAFVQYYLTLSEGNTMFISLLVIPPNNHLFFEEKHKNNVRVCSEKPQQQQMQ